MSFFIWPWHSLDFEIAISSLPFCQLQNYLEFEGTMHSSWKKQKILECIILFLQSLAAICWEKMFPNS